MAQARTLITAEQLPEVARDRRVELVYGELVEMTPVGLPHGRLVISFGSLMRQAALHSQSGAVMTEVGFVLSRDPDSVRAPDVAFLAASRLAGQSEGFFEGAPDIAVEVLSPDDRASEVQAKTRQYLAAGTRLVLIIDPLTKTVAAHYPSGDAHVYSGDDQMSLEDIIAGFRFRPSDVFQGL